MGASSPSVTPSSTGPFPGSGFRRRVRVAPRSLAAPIVGIVPTVDDHGYFMVGADGGVFTFGDAKFEGSCPGIGGCSGTAVAVMPDASGNGYWLVTNTGHVYAFGDAVDYGQPDPQLVPVTSAVRTTDGKGYWLLYANGAVAAFGDAPYFTAALGEVGGIDPATAILTTRMVEGSGSSRPTARSSPTATPPTTGAWVGCTSTVRSSPGRGGEEKRRTVPSSPS